MPRRHRRNEREIRMKSVSRWPNLGPRPKNRLLAVYRAFGSRLTIHIEIQSFWGKDNEITEMSGRWEGKMEFVTRILAKYYSVRGFGPDGSGQSDTQRRS